MNLYLAQKKTQKGKRSEVKKNKVRKSLAEAAIAGKTWMP
jgi:hypothetical protein